jgi:hypothetical protein
MLAAANYAGAWKLNNHRSVKRYRALQTGQDVELWPDVNVVFVYTRLQHCSTEVVISFLRHLLARRGSARSIANNL